MRIVTLLLSIIFSFNICQLSGQEEIVYDNMVYVPYIKSVNFSHRSLATSLPIIDLNTRSEGALRLEFDDIEGEFKNYTYSIVHCDKDWNPSGLDEIEFMEGFNGEEIDRFEFSSNPYSEYTHYTLDLPNFDVVWTISGNYLLTVRDEDYNVPVITRRFMVAENEMVIFYDLIRPRNIQKMNTHHELNVAINFEGFNITRPRDELYISCLLYTSPSPRDATLSRMPSSA